MQNYFYFNRNPYINNIPRAFYSFQNQASRNIVSSSFNFNTLLNTAQKGINTINQIIPMYKQIKPIYQQAKSSFNSIKKYLNFPIFNQRNANRNNTSTYSFNQNNTNAQSNINFENNGPSSPFFG